jgi:hypothetical protein
MTAVAHKGLKEILEPLIGWTDARNLAEAWAARERSAIKQVDKLLASAGLTMDAVMAQALSLKLDHIERIDRMIATAEGRRTVRLCSKSRRPRSRSSTPNQIQREPRHEQRAQDKRESRECARKQGPENRSG